MSFCITLTLWKRPAYTARQFDSLMHCAGIRDCDLIIGINPHTPTLRELQSLCHRIDFARSVRVIVHDKDIGCNLNKLAVLRAAFENHDYVACADDDIIFAPDALSYMQWAKQFGADSEIFTVTLWKHFMGWLPESGIQKPHGVENKVSRQQFFACYGWATWRDRWSEMEAGWPRGYAGPYYDEVLCEKMRGARFEIAPHISRAINIGVHDGLHESTQRDFSYWAGSKGFLSPAHYEWSDP